MPNSITLVFGGSCNSGLFEAWVEQFLIKELTIRMDNASFYKSKKARELIKSVKCSIIFLSPYSPDLNLIEKLWANMKGY